MIGAELLDELQAALMRYVVLSSAEAADAVTLWVAASHGQPAWEHAPRLVITAPEKRCGKSRLLDIIEGTCHNPLITVNVSVAAVTRSIGDDPPTLLVDESDAIFGPKVQGDKEELRGILNAGHQRNRPSIRYNVNKNAVEKLNTFAFAALAGIGDMPDTIMDRAVIVRMRRRAPGETVQPFRSRRDGPPLHDLRGRLNDWTRDNLAKLVNATPDMPVEDRAADTWEPLVAVADLAGGTWPGRARKAAKVLTDVADADDSETSLSLRLLADLRAIFGDAPGLHSATILERLHAIEDGPWADFYGKPFDARSMSRRLKPYGVTPKDVREDGTGPNRKGYSREQLWDAWTRYLLPTDRDEGDKGDMPGQPCRGQIPVADASATAETSATGLTSEVADVADVADTPQSCGTCGTPLLLTIAGRTTCERCRIARQAAS